MNNSSSNSSPETAFMQLFAHYTPHILIGVTIATFLLVGGMQFSYYSKAFENSASTLDWIFGLTIALVTQSARFALVTNGANHFAHNRQGKGIFSCIFSAALTGICSYEMSHLADVWANQNPEYGAAIPIIVQTIIWLGFGLELMLISAVSGSNAPNLSQSQQQQNQSQRRQNQPNGAPFDLTPFLQGSGANS